MRHNDENHQRSRRTPLVLPSFDLEVQSTDVDAAASLLDGMTIVPSPTVMSLASPTIPTPTLWSDARDLPFATRSGGARGDSVSVLTTVTAPPTLQGRAVFGGGSGGGGQMGVLGGVGWHELRNHSKLPRSGKFYLSKVERGDGICKGFIGSTREIICCNENCTIGAHAKPSVKWNPPAGVVFLIPAIKQGKSTAAFVIPSVVLEGDHLPQLLLGIASNEKRTLKKWADEFFPYARAQAAELISIQEDGEDDEDSLSQDEDFDADIETSNFLADFEWVPLTTTQYKPFVAEEEVNRSEDGIFAVELRESIVGIRDELAEAKSTAREDATRVMAVVNKSHLWMLEKLTKINRRGIRLREDLGDMSGFTLQHTYPNLINGFQDLFTQVDELQRETRLSIKSLNNQVVELHDDFVVVDSDVTTNLPRIFNQVGTLSSRVQSLENGVGAPILTTSALTTLSIVNDCVTGSPLFTLGNLLQKLTVLENENSSLKSQMGTKGVVSLGAISFPSLSVLESVVGAELQLGGLMCFELFVDCSTVHCHNANVDPGNSSSTLSWDKATKEMGGKGYGATPRKMVRAVNEHVSSLYTDGKEAIAGNKIAAFTSSHEWSGEDAREGRRVRVEDKIASAIISARASIEAKLPATSVLRELALAMLSKTEAWFVVLHRHLDTELQRLGQIQLDKDALLVLLSEEVIILFNLVHNVRKKGLEFSLTCDFTDFMARWIWLTLEIHGVMDNMIRDGISSNGVISSAFIRFLTKQIALTAASGAKPDSKGDAWKHKMESEVAKAVAAGTEAKSAVKNAQQVAVQGLGPASRGFVSFAKP